MQMLKDISQLAAEKMLVKNTSYLALWQPLCSAGQNPISAILVECIMRNNSVKLFRIWTSGSGDVV